MFDDALLGRATGLIAAYAKSGLRITTAESCTGGLVAGLLTAVPGSSAAVERGFVTYSNEAKAESLGVPPELIAVHGAVSREVAEAMAAGALAHSRAGIAVAVTGIAGPGGGTPTKPVGTVWIAVASSDRLPVATLLQASGDRASVRHRSVVRAFELLLERCGTEATLRR